MLRGASGSVHLLTCYYLSASRSSYLSFLKWRVKRAVYQITLQRYHIIVD